MLLGPARERRCRREREQKKRAWWELERECKERATERRVAKEKRVQALASRMPEELFERVLAHMDYRGFPANWELGRCALVSTFWAPRCQEKIFRRIAIHNGKDVQDLDSYLRRPRWIFRITQYI